MKPNLKLVEPEVMDNEKERGNFVWQIVTALGGAFFSGWLAAFAGLALFFSLKS